MPGSGLRDGALAEAVAGAVVERSIDAAGRAGVALPATLRGVGSAPPAASQAALEPLSTTSTHTRKELESKYDRTRIHPAPHWSAHRE